MWLPDSLFFFFLSKFLWITLIEWNKDRFRLKDPEQEDIPYPSDKNVACKLWTVLLSWSKSSSIYVPRKSKCRLSFQKQMLPCWEGRSHLVHSILIHKRFWLFIFSCHFQNQSSNSIWQMNKCSYVFIWDFLTEVWVYFQCVLHEDMHTHGLHVTFWVCWIFCPDQR